MLDKKGFHVPTCAVVSAAAGVTDELIAVVQVRVYVSCYLPVDLFCYNFSSCCSSLKPRLGSPLGCIYLRKQLAY